MRRFVGTFAVVVGLVFAGQLASAQESTAGGGRAEVSVSGRRHSLHREQRLDLRSGTRSVRPPNTLAYNGAGRHDTVTESTEGSFSTYCSRRCAGHRIGALPDFGIWSRRRPAMLDSGVHSRVDNGWYEACECRAVVSSRNARIGLRR